MSTCSQPIAAGQDPAGQGRQEAGTERGRLAAAGGADEAQERVADELGHQLGDQPVAAEVVLGVDGLERGQALVRADGDARSPGGLLICGARSGASAR